MRHRFMAHDIVRCLLAGDRVGLTAVGQSNRAGRARACVVQAETAPVAPQEPRRVVWSRRSPLVALDDLSARTVLERLPLPVIGVGADGYVLFANAEFAGLLGCDVAALSDAHVEELFALPPTGGSVIEQLRSCVGRTLELRGTGYAVAVRVSQSLLRRREDPLTLVILHDITAWG
jgi:PAS domain-containing protein